MVDELGANIRHNIGLLAEGQQEVQETLKEMDVSDVIEMLRSALEALAGARTKAHSNRDKGRRMFESTYIGAEALRSLTESAAGEHVAAMNTAANQVVDGTRVQHMLVGTLSHELNVVTNDLQTVISGLARYQSICSNIAQQAQETLEQAALAKQQGEAYMSEILRVQE